MIAIHLLGYYVLNNRMGRLGYGARKLKMKTQAEEDTSGFTKTRLQGRAALRGAVYLPAMQGGGQREQRAGTVQPPAHAAKAIVDCPIQKQIVGRTGFGFAPNGSQFQGIIQGRKQAGGESASESGAMDSSSFAVLNQAGNPGRPKSFRFGRFTFRVSRNRACLRRRRPRSTSSPNNFLGLLPGGGTSLFQGTHVFERDSRNSPAHAHHHVTTGRDANDFSFQPGAVPQDHRVRVQWSGPMKQTNQQGDSSREYGRSRTPAPERAHGGNDERNEGNHDSDAGKY